MGFGQVGLCECHIAAQHGEVGVPHELLQLEEVAAAAEEVHGEGMPLGIGTAADPLQPIQPVAVALVRRPRGVGAFACTL